MALSFILAGQIYSPARTGAPQIVENPETPKYSENEAPELVFKREISVPLAGRRFSFDVDDSGNIYLLESLAGQISVYDKNGQLITQFGKKGQGPGEFENPFFLSVSMTIKYSLSTGRERRSKSLTYRGSGWNRGVFLIWG